jgi:hypothetical protein
MNTQSNFRRSKKDHSEYQTRSLLFSKKAE